MMNMNPQLQSEVFDSLLLHMQAERKVGKAAKVAKVEKVGKVKLSETKIPEATREWDNLAADLHRLGLNKTMADSLVSWATGQAELSRQSPVKIRVLHPMEREFISVEAYNYLLELYRIGLIGPPQLENLIENCAFLTSLPATRAQIGKMALNAFTEHLEMQGLGSSH